MSEYDEKRKSTEGFDRSGAGTVSRRQFLKLAGVTGAVVGLGGGLGALLGACGEGGATTTTAATVATTTTAAVTTTAGGATTTTGAATSTSGVAAMGEKAVFAVEDFGRDIPFGWLNGPRDARPWFQIFDPLIGVDESKPGEYQPGLFTEWSPSADYKTWTFKLRQGVMFHEDYGEMTSADVKWCFEQTLRPDAAGFQNSWFQTTLESIDAPDKYTVVMNCKRSAWELVDELTPYYTMMTISSKTHLEKVGEQAAMAHPIGTGPYHFVSGTQGSTYQFEAVPNHWRLTPGFKQLEMRAVADEATRVAGLQSNEFDTVMAAGDSLAQVKSAGLTVANFPGIMTYFVTLPGLTTPKFKNYSPQSPWVGAPDAASQAKAVQVRKALNLAVNKQAIIDAFWQGYGTQTPFSYFYYPQAPGWSDKWVIPPYDPEQAKTLLKDAGYPSGFEIPVLMVNQAVDGPQLMEAIAQDWEKIGLKVKRANAAMLDLLPQIRDSSWTQAWVFAYPLICSNPYASWLDNLGIGSPAANFIRNDEIEAEVQAIGTESDAAKRVATMSAIGQKLYDGYYGVMIGVKGMTYGAGPKIGTWNPPAPGMYYTAAEYMQWSGK